MAANTNTITLVGNLTRDPEMRYTQSGQSNCRLGIAVNRSWRNQQTNEWEERTSFFNVVCWAELAENVTASVQKGMRVVVTGRLEQRSWETEQGEKNSIIEVVADDVAPSLRWASAEITRNERKGPGEFGGARTGGGAGAPATAGPGAGSYDDLGEEPF